MEDGIMIVEDNLHMRNSLIAYVDGAEGFYLMGAYASCEEMLPKLKQQKPRIVLMDIDLAGMDGIQGTSEIKKRSPKTDVIMITVFENSKNVFSALKAGATGYLTKTVDSKELVLAMKECLAGGAPMSMKIARLIITSFNRNPDNPLSEREIDVLTELSKGKSYKGVSEILFISVDAVKYHIKSIYVKLSANSKQDAVDIARREKYI